MKKIAVMGANAARQKTLKFNSFNYGEVNRAVSMDVCAAGKGINFCRAAGVYGQAYGVLIQFAGGENGRFIENFLREEKLDVVNIRTAAPTRCCITCLDVQNQVMTEVIEPSFPATADECDEFIKAFCAALKDADGAAICGSLPDGTDPSLYLRAGSAALDAGVPLLLDAYKNLETLLLKGGNIILKINREELAKLTGIEGVEAGLIKLFDTYSIRYAAITDGSSTAYASDGKTLATFAIPEVDPVVNPIGCGDTASAVLMSELCCGCDFFEAFRIALGCASANVMSLMPGDFDVATAKLLAGKTVVAENILNRSV